MSSPSSAARRAVLLDRDGTLNVNRADYVKNVDELEAIPGAFEAVGRLSAAGWRIAVVTNQSCIGKGIVDAAAVDAVNEECRRLAADQGGEIDGFYISPDRPDSTSDTRKPAPGLLLQAAREQGYDLSASYTIGDSARDLEAGRRAGTTPLLVLTGHGEVTREQINHPEEWTFVDLEAAVAWILSNEASALDLTVVIPAFNEADRLSPTLERVEAWLQTRNIRWEILIVDDGSSDDTQRIASEWAQHRSAVEVISLPANRGKGAAVREGLRRSRGRQVLFSDADLSTPIEELASLETAIREGTDFALASRALPTSQVPVRQAWFRETMGKTFNLLVRGITGIPFLDTQCGFKLLRGDLARRLAGEMEEEGFAFDVELVLLARRAGAAIREIPVTWRNEQGSRVDPVTDSWNMLWALPRILSRTGRYRHSLGKNNAR